jgi:hypothetical protein
MDHFGWHYYGDIVRRLFLTAGVIMLITLPVLTTLLPVQSYVSLLIIIAMNTVISAVGMFFYEYYAVTGYFLPEGTPHGTLFTLTNQVLAIIFFFAIYYSSKSVRGIKR